MEYGEWLGDRKGLYVLYTPGYDQICTPALFLSGAQLCLFTTGRGTGIIDKNNNKTGGTDPGSHLPPGCSQNCAPPRIVKNNGNGGNNQCLGDCPSEGFRARIAGTRRR